MKKYLHLNSFKIKETFTMFLLIFATILANGQVAPVRTITVGSDVACGKLIDVELELTGTGSYSTPLEVILVIDVSGSMAWSNSDNTQSKIEDAVDAAETFVDNFFGSGKHPNSKLGIVKFAYNGSVVQSLTASKTPFDAANFWGVGYNENFYANGSTNMEDGIEEAYNELLNNGSDDCNVTKTIIMLGDGAATVDNGSGDPSTRAILDALTAQSIAQIYTIGFNVGVGSSAENTLTEMQNAGYYAGASAADLNNIYTDILNQLNWVAKAPLSGVFSTEAVEGNFQIDNTSISVSKGSFLVSGQNIEWYFDYLNKDETVTLTYQLISNGVCNDAISTEVSSSSVTFLDPTCNSQSLVPLPTSFIIPCSGDELIEICEGESTGNFNSSITCPEAGISNNQHIETYAVSGSRSSGSGDDWQNTGNITADDGQTASLFLQSGDSEHLYAKDFNFSSIPDNATIKGITLEINRWASSISGSDGVKDDDVRLLKNGSAVGNNKKKSTAWSTNSATIATYGGANDLWGTSWTVADIKNSNFGASLEVNINSSRSAFVDYIKIKVDYSITTVAGELEWFTAEVGGTSLHSGNDFSPSDDDPNFDSDQPGTYNYYAGCSNIPGCRRLYRVIVNAKPDCDITGTATSCPSSTETFTAPAEMSSYSWSITSGTATINGAANGSSVEVIAGNCDEDFTIELTTTNANGCSSTCSLDVEVKDITAPEFVAISDLELTCYDASAIDTWLNGQEATDNCGGTVTITNNYSAPNDLTVCQNGTTTVTFTATDVCGNDVTTTADIIITDDVDPTFVAISDLELTCYDASAIDTWLNGQEATDNCGGTVTITNNYSAPNDLTVCQNGTTTVTFTATDVCGNDVTTTADIIITDDVDPTFVAISDLELTCYDASAIDTWLNGQEATDNCGGTVTITNNYSAPNDLTVCQNGTTTVTFTATDVCGNDVTTTADIIITDDVDPTFVAISDLELTCYDASAIDTWLNGQEATDNCGGTVTITNNYSAPNDLTVCQNGTTTVTFTATDVCGNDVTTTADIIITDDVDPTFVAISDLELTCYDASAIDTWLNGQEATDNCGGTVTITNNYSAPNDLTVCQNGTTTVTFTATDVCGNDVTTTADIIITDDVDPTFVAISDLELTCYDASAIDTWLNGQEATDNCGGTVTITNNYSAPNDLTVCQNGTTTVTFTATDVCGNDVTTTADIIITDDVDPTFVAISDLELTCYDASAIDTWLNGQEATDNCGGTVTITNNYSAPNDLTVCQNGTTTVTFTATDVCGNDVTTTADIIITDDVDPTFVAISDLELTCYDASAIDTWLNGQEATDNCGGTVTITNNYSAPNDLTVCQNGTTTVTFTATDVCGNDVTTTADIIITDDVDPTFVAISDLELTCYDASAIDTWLNGQEATDNCGGTVTITNNYSAPNDLTVCQNGTTTVTFTATDVCGNDVTTTADIIITDDVDPTFVAISDLELTCYDASAIDTWLNGQEATDNCGGTVTITNNYSAPNDLTVCQNGTTTVTFTATDVCGNDVTTTADIIITDDVDPTFVAISDLELTCYDASAIDTWLNGQEATDNCGGTVTITNNYSAPNDLTVCQNGTTTVTFTATDVCGNDVTTTADIIITDDVDPTFVAISDLELTCYDASAIDTWLNGQEATDNCGGTVTITNNYSAPNDLTVCQNGTTTVTFTATDVCGNDVTTTADIIITDDVDPTFVAISDLELTCYDASAIDTWLNGQEATDNCGGTVTITNNYSAPNDLTVCQNGTTTVTFTATDVCGNDVTTTADIIITDDVDPTFVAISDLELTCYDASAIDTWLNGQEATDNCGGTVTITNNYSAPNDLTVCQNGTTTVTFTATDVCGNDVTTTADIIITDDVDPTFVAISDLELTCYDASAIDTWLNGQEATDNCGGTVTITNNYSAPNDLTVCQNGTTTVTFTATDVCGNDVTTTADIIITDDVDPTFVAISDLELTCYDASAIDTWLNGQEATDNCGGTVTITNNYSAPNDLTVCQNGTTTVTFTATDVCGNDVTTTADIIITDDVDPTFVAISDLELTCYDASAIDTWLNGQEATDNCGGTVTITNNYSAPNDLTVCQNGTTTVTFTATDVCGNDVTTTADIIITDDVDPTFVAISDLELTCYDASAIDTWLNGQEATDNCGGTVTITNNYSAPNDLTVCQNGTTTVTFTATDVCGNDVTTTADIIITDDVDPTFVAISDLELTCYDASAIDTWLNGQEATDNCGGTVTITNNYSAPNDLTVCQNGTTTVTFTATDVCGNDVTTTADIIITDDVDPTFVAISDLELTCYDASAIDTWLNGQEATDNCGGTVTITNNYSAPNDLTVCQNGTTTVTFTATDVCGNDVTTTADIIITDDVDPTFVAISDLELTCYDASAIDTWLNGQEATDNCGGTVTITNNYSAPNDLTVCQNGTTTVTFTATDVCGNDVTTTADIIITDDVDPTFVAISDLELTCYDASAIDTWLNGQEATDNCGGTVTITNNYSAPNDLTVCQNGTTTVTFTATDVCGNDVTTTADIIITDDVDPTFVAISDLELTCYDASAIDTWLNGQEATDNCGGTVTITNNYSAPNDLTVCQNGTTTVTFTATDVCGNDVTTTADIIITDDVDPTFVAISDLELTCYDASAIDTWLNGQEATDNCGGTVTITNNYSAPNDLTVCQNGTTTVTFTATDVCGNDVTTTADIIITDDVDPTFVAISDLELTCYDASAIDTWLNGQEATDNCGGTVTITNNYSAPNDLTVCQNGTTTVTFTATDVCGNDVTTTADIIITDDVDPTFVAISDLELTCYDASAIDTWLNGQEATDNCGGTVTITNNYSAPNDLTVCQNGTTTVTFTATDVCGNDVTTTADIIITDDVDPTFVAISDLELTCYDASAIDTWLNGQEATDNCGGTVTITNNYSAPNDLTVCQNGTTTVTFTATDVCGNDVTTTADIIITDDVDPTFVAISDLELTCYDASAIDTWLNGQEATDNCGGTVTITNNYSAPNDLTVCQNGTTTVTFTATDVCGNDVTTTADIIITDDVDPTFVAISDLELTCYDASAIDTWLNGQEATDNCGGTVTITNNYSAPNDLTVCQNGTTTVTFTATDVCGNDVTTTADIIITDDVDPTFVAISDLELTCYDASAIDTWLNGQEATDNCGGTVTITNNYSAPNDLTVCQNGTTTVTFTATDVCGNDVTTTADIIITDDVDPTFVAISDLELTCYDASAIDTWLNGQEATDNCGGTVTITNNYSAPNDLTVCQNGTTTVTFTATDVCGNDVTTTADIIITDDVDPTFVAISDLELTCYDASAIDTWLNGQEATDNCGGTVTITNNYSAPNDLTVCQNGTTTVTFTATDVCGNDVTTTADIIITDDVDPTFVAISDLELTCYDASAIDTWLNGQEATDNCGGTVTITNNYSAPNDLTVCQNGTTTVTFTATDVCGNDVTTTADIIITDDVDPTFVAISDLELTCYDASAIDTWLNGQEATDNCGGTVTITNNYSAPNDLTVCQNGTTTVTFTATDVCGNDVTTTADIIITDDVDPTFVAISDLELTCYDASAIDTWLNGQEATDNCGGTVTITNNYSAPNDLTVCQNGTTTVTFTATDVCGNDVTTTADIIITDDVDPTFVAISDLELTCYDASAIDTWLNGQEATDNCGGTVTITNNYSAPNDLTVCQNGTTTVTFTATDVCGNDVTTTADIIITDDVDPTFVAISDLELTCYDASAIDTWLNGQEATDNCGGTVTITNNYSAPNDLTVCQNGTTTVTFTATDVCGNDVTTTADIIITDDVDPTFVAISDLELTCYDASAIDTWLNGQEATDNCGGTVTITNNYSAPNDLTVCQNGTTTVTFTATDVCGNDVTTTADIIITDDVDPTFVAISDLELTCYDASAIDTWLNGQEATDNCGGTVTITNNYSAPNDLTVCQNGTTTVTFTATDVCGNDVTTTADIIITDDVDPTFVAISDLELTCYDASAIDTWLNGQEATDNCGGTVTITNNYSAPNDLTVCQNGTTTVTFTATDVCGNDVTTTADIIITDDVDPTFVAISDLELTCYDASAIDTWLNGQEATDNCGGTVTITNNYSAPNDLTVCQNGTTTVTFTATDVCGNDVTTTADIIITDDVDPTFVAISDLELTCYDASAIDTWLNGQEATDNCGGTVTITNNYSAPNDLTVCQNGTTTVTFTATDVCGNDVTTTADIIITDDVDPIINNSELSDINIECGIDPASKLTNWLASNAGATATDNCSDVTWSNNYGENDQVDCENGAITVIFTATDDCGNKSTTTATYSIQDNTPPTIDVEASNKMVECDGNGNQTELDAWLSSHGGASASDDCSDIKWSNNYETLSDDCSATGSATVTFTATDGCGNESTTTATFTIEDNTKPEWDEDATPADLTVECDGSGNTTELEAWLESFSGNDICGEATVTNNYNAEMFEAACGATGSVTVTFTLSDDCDNSIQKEATFTIEDNTKPEWDEDATPADLTVECDGSGNTTELQAWLESFSGNDICGEATVTNNYNAEMFEAACGATGSVTVTFTLSDDCDNSIQKEATFTIEDNTKPEWDEDATPADLTVECDGSGNTTELEAWLESFSGNDICGEATVTNNYNAEMFEAACGATGSVTVTFTLSDDCDNSIQKEATFTVIDKSNPTFVEELPAAEITAECDNVVEAVVLTATDNCDSDVQVVFTETRTDGDCANSYTLTRTWTATDDCGNETSFTQTVVVSDNTAPEVTCNDITIQLDANGVATITVDDINGGATDACGSIATMFISQETFNCDNVGENQVTLTAIDECGNEATCTATVTVEEGDADCGFDPFKANDDMLTLVYCPNGTVSGDLDLFANDEGFTRENVSFTILTDLPEGVSVTDGNLLYTNEDPTEAVITFTYSVCHTVNTENCDTAEVTIQVLVDTDCDGVPDLDDLDDDDDGILDIIEEENALDQTSLDSDGDGIVDRLDIDSDNDGIVDNIEWQSTIAEDGEYDYIFPLGTDSNNDGWDDAYDPSSNGITYEPWDMDLDGTPDYLDTNTDNEGEDDIVEGWDEFPNDSIADVSYIGSDADGDGLDDAYDTYNTTTEEWGPGQNAIGSDAYLQDTDDDGVRDWRDAVDDRPVPERFACGEPVIPNAFSPNQDGYNDYFKMMIYCTGDQGGSEERVLGDDYTDARIEIFNRWGNLVYEQERYGNEDYWGDVDAWWDGRSMHDMQVGDDQLPTATYYYILYFNDGSKEPITGFIFLNN